MEKFIFLATLKDRLTEMNLPQESINKHTKLFDDCLKGKSAEEIEKIIEGAGGIDGIVASIGNLESAKSKNKKSKTSGTTEAIAPEAKNDQPTQVEQPSAMSDGNSAQTPETDNKETVTSVDSETQPAVEPQVEETEGVATEVIAETESTDDSELPTMEIPKSPDIDKHILEAEKMTETMERLPAQPDAEAELIPELSDYDFEKLFEEKLSKPEAALKRLREKISPQKYKATLPLAILAAAMIFLFVSALFPLLIASAVVFGVIYICTLVAGICFALIPIGYGIFMCFKSIPVALYELGIGIISSGVTMFVGILLYNYVKRLVPYLFKKLIKLFKFCVKLTKRYFGKQIKEEA